MSKKDCYEILGVSRSASVSEIKKSYLNLAKEYHPDRNKGNPSAEKKFKEINEAYEILKDEQKKAAYDQFGHGAFSDMGGRSGFRQSSGGFQGADFSDIFGDFFNDFMGSSANSTRKGASIQTRGSDLKYSLAIDLKEAFKGVDKSISFTTVVKCSPCEGKGTKEANATTTCKQCAGSGIIRMQQGFFAIEQTCNSCSGAGQIIKNPCSNCHGSGRVSKQKSLIINIPAGVEDNTRIRLAGKGEAGIRGGSNGDLYVFVTVKPHDIFKVEGSNLHFKLPISFTKAVLGGEVEIPTIDGSRVKLSIPAGTETGDKIKLKDKGMSKVRSLSRGDLYAHIYVQVPKKLTKRQKELIEELDKELGQEESNYNEAGFFNKMKNLWS